MNSQNFWKLGTKIGLFFVVIFTACFAWYFIRGGNAELLQLHNNLLALTFFGWSGMNIASFVLGLIQSFIWGYIAVGLWQLAISFTKN